MAYQNSTAYIRVQCTHRVHGYLALRNFIWDWNIRGEYNKWGEVVHSVTVWVPSLPCRVIFILQPAVAFSRLWKIIKYNTWTAKSALECIQMATLYETKDPCESEYLMLRPARRNRTIERLLLSGAVFHRVSVSSTGISSDMEDILELWNNTNCLCFCNT